MIYKEAYECFFEREEPAKQNSPLLKLFKINMYSPMVNNQGL